MYTIKLKKGSLILLLLFLFIETSFSQTWKEYDFLRKTNQDKKEYNTALTYAEKALEEVKNTVGTKDTLYVSMLSNVMRINYYLGNNQKAIEYLTEETNIRREIQGDRSLPYATSLNNLGFLYYALGNYANAEPLYIEAIDIEKEKLGNQNPSYASSLNNLAVLYYNKKEYDKAESLYIEAKNIIKSTYGDKDLSYISALNSLAVLYDARGELQKAEPLYLEVLRLRKEILGEKHPDYTTTLNNLAFLYKNLENYKKSENLYLETISTRKEVLGDKNPDYVQSINDLGVLYYTMEEYDKAEPLYLKAKKIRKEILGENHSDYATSLNNLAVLYHSKDLYSKAEPIYIQAKDIRKSVLGVKHILYSNSLNNLAALYYNMEEYPKSDVLYTEAKDIAEEVDGKSSLRYAFAITNLAILYDAMEKNDEAEVYYVEAKNIIKSNLGVNHQAYINSINYLAGFYYGNNEHQKSKELFEESIDITNKDLVLNNYILTTESKEIYFESKYRNYDIFNSFAIKYKNINPEIVSVVFNNTLKNKSLLLQSDKAVRYSFSNTNNQQELTKYNNWLDLERKLKKLYSKPVLERKENVEEIEIEANKIQSQLENESELFKTYNMIQNSTWKDIQSSLEPEEVAIEFIHFRYFEGDWKDSTIYCALVVNPQSQFPEMIELCKEKDLVTVLNNYNGNKESYLEDIYKEGTTSNNKLYELIWKPLEKYIANSKKIYLSTTGLLNTVNLYAIANKQKSLDVSVNLSVSNLLIKEKGLPKINENINASIFSEVSYSSDTTKQEIWANLNGNESETITKLFKKNGYNNTLFANHEASINEFIRIAPTSNILHLSTYTFFYPSRAENKKFNITSTFNSNEAKRMDLYIQNKSSLSRTGLVFAGANDINTSNILDSNKYGIISANDIVQLNLQQTNLVVLSSSEINFKYNNNVEFKSLQRAFKMAGVDYILMSIWKIPLKERNSFLNIFYSEFKELKDAKIAFTNAQQKMRKKYDSFYWASFILIE